MANKGFQLDKRKVAVLKALQGAMVVVANQSENHFKKSFRDGGFTDTTLRPWTPRKRPSRADKNARGRSRAILVQSGALRRSIVKTRLNGFKYKITSDLPYSAIHNEGLPGLAWGKHTFKMPKRQFIGVSRVLRDKHIKTFNKFVIKALTQ